MLVRGSVVAAVMGMGLLLLAGCGTQQPSQAADGGVAKSAADPIIPSELPDVAGANGTVRAWVSEPTNRSATTVRYLRVEDPTGKPLVQREYRASAVDFREQFSPGRYRVVSWVQECGGSCEGKSAAQFASPVRTCGVQIEVRENATTEVYVDAPAYDNCTMTVSLA